MIDRKIFIFLLPLHNLFDILYSTNFYCIVCVDRHYTSHRHLKKYGPVIVDTDVETDNGDGYGRYENVGEYGAVANYESENHNNVYKQYGAGGGSSQANADHGSNGIVSWYTEPLSGHSSRPAAVKAEVQNPGHKMTIDTSKLGLLAAIKLVLIKLKALMVVKFLLALAVKLKTLLLFTLKTFAKFFIFSKLLKFAILPLMPSLLPLLRRLLSPVMPTPSPMDMMMNMDMGGNRFRNDTVAVVESAHRQIAAGSSGDEPIEAANLVQFATTMYSTKCVEKMACTAAAGRPPSLQSILTNW